MSPRRWYRPPPNEPVCWIVIRRRGGWNAEPKVVGIHNTEGRALMESCMAVEWGLFDPPADETDVFTCHRVMPSLIDHGPSRTAL